MKKINVYSLSEIFPDKLNLAERIIFDPEYEKIVLVNEDFIEKQSAHWDRENARVDRIEYKKTKKQISKRREVNDILLHLDYMLNYMLDSEDEFLIVNE